MEQLQAVQKTIPSSPPMAGKKRGNWRTERIFSASKKCAYCGKVFTPWIKRDADGKFISGMQERRWEKQRFCSISCAKKAENPMSDKQSREKMRQTLLRIQHKPIVRGGNGKLLPLPQLALLHALGDGWVAEYVVNTGDKSRFHPYAYKIDIANPVLKIAIEVDGPSHNTTERRAQDTKKTNLLTSLGWSVYRVSNAKALALYSTYKSPGTLLTSLMST